MRSPLVHPLWTHLPAGGLALVSLVAFWRAWPLPDPAPVHFGADGTPDRYGASWEIPAVVLLVCCIAIGLSIAVDEAWARQERRKRFNWLSLGDEIFVAFMTGMTIQYVDAVAHTRFVLHHSWGLVSSLAAVSLLAAFVLERLRPFRPSEEALVQEDTAELERLVRARQQSQQAWLYWESHNPRHARWLLPILGLGLLTLGFMSWNDNRWASLAAIGGGVLVLGSCAGGFHISVTPDRVRLRAGLVNVRLLELPMKDIAVAESHRFSPLADFGGWGIRRNREMRAFFLEGNTGVKLTTKQGKSYLIGSASPERLASVIRAALGP